MNSGEALIFYDNVPVRVFGILQRDHPRVWPCFEDRSLSLLSIIWMKYKGSFHSTYVFLVIAEMMNIFGHRIYCFVTIVLASPNCPPCVSGNVLAYRNCHLASMATADCCSKCVRTSYFSSTLPVKMTRSIFETVSNFHLLVTWHLETCIIIAVSQLVC